MAKTIEEINEKIRRGKAVVLTAEEIIDYAAEKGVKKAAQEVDVVTTGTFGPMCSSGAYFNVGHSKPRIKLGGGKPISTMFRFIRGWPLLIFSLERRPCLKMTPETKSTPESFLTEAPISLKSWLQERMSGSLRRLMERIVIRENHWKPTSL